MSLLPSNHALSVHVNSCRSSPKEKMSSCKSKSDSTVSLGCKPFSSCNSSQGVNLGKALGTRSYYVRSPVSAIASNEDTTGVFQTSDFTSLITTLLESNRILHKEIQQMQREHRKTMTTLTQFYQQAKYETPTSDCGSVHDGGSVEKTSLHTHPRTVKTIEMSKDKGCDTVGGGVCDDCQLADVSGRSDGDVVCSNRVELEVNVTAVNRTEKGSKLCRKEKLICEDSMGGNEGKEGERTSDEGDSMGGNEGEGEEISSEDEEESIVDGNCSISEDANFLDDSDHDDEGKIQLECVPAVESSAVSSSCSTEFGRLSCDEEGEEVNQTGRSDPDPLASPGMEAVKKMWDKFSVNDYDFITYFEGPVIKSKPKKWTPRITVPQPFNMTIREGTFPIKKSKSLEIAEKEVLERKTLEDRAVQKQFRATPIPANTFLPLFDLINARNEQRRETVKEECAKMLEFSQKPFSFYKRDTLKHEHREGMLKQCREQEVANLKKKQFKARPVPTKLFAPEIDEKLWEKEEYRRIRKKMRADDLLTKSKLPSRMQESRSDRDLGKAYREKLEENEAKAFMTEEHCFHPCATHNIPDYDKVYHKFQQQLELKKLSKSTTITEPFQLQTDAVCSKRRKKLQDKIQAAEENAKLLPCGFSRLHRNPRRSPYPTQMTQTARLRQSKTQDKMAQQMHKELEEEEDQRARKIQQRMMQKEVNRKASRMDPSPWLEESKRRKMEEFR